MEELIEKMNNLIDELDNNKSIINIKRLNKRISEDKELLLMIERYRNNRDINIKKDIINNSLFREYKEEERNVNFIILEINKRLRNINSKGKCHR